jgi:hypothetical protein
MRESVGNVANTAGSLTTTRKDLVMAELKLAPTMAVDEIRALADRLEARGTSVLMRDQPAQCADLECAAHLLRMLAGSGAISRNGR